MISLRFLLLLYFAFESTFLAAQKVNPKVEKINAIVAELIKKTDPDKYDVLSITQPGTFEGNPPSLEFYANKDTGKLVAVRIHVGHETWAKEIWYVFNEKEKILKYSHESKGLPKEYASPKMAKIFDGGTEIWSNLKGTMRVEPSEIVAQFHKLQAIRGKFAPY